MIGEDESLTLRAAAEADALDRFTRRVLAFIASVNRRAALHAEFGDLEAARRWRILIALRCNFGVHPDRLEAFADAEASKALQRFDRAAVPAQKAN